MLKWPSSLLELEEKECCWSPDPRLWSRFSFWMPENIHPSSASLAESSSDGFKWEPWRPRQGGGNGSLGNWWHWEDGLSSSSLLLPLLPVPWLVCSTKTNCCCSSFFFYLWPSLSLRCFLVLTCCTGRDEKVFLFHHSLWQEFPCSSLRFCPCGHSRT